MTDPKHTEPGELLPCPFCGGEAHLWPVIMPFDADCDTITVQCSQCDAIGADVLVDQDVHSRSDLPDLEAEAIAAWNTRTAAEAASRQEVERLREALARLREALAETREMLGLCEQIICDETCPTTWRTADGQPHGQMHKDICDVLARHEHHIHPARSALTASEAPDA